MGKKSRRVREKAGDRPVQWKGTTLAATALPPEVKKFLDEVREPQRVVEYLMSRYKMEKVAKLLSPPYNGAFLVGFFVPNVDGTGQHLINGYMTVISREDGTEQIEYLDIEGLLAIGVQMTEVQNDLKAMLAYQAQKEQHKRGLLIP